MQKTILITGGTGFLGKRLGVALSRSHRVVLGGRNNKQNKQAQEFAGCEVLPLDVTNIESVRDAVVAVRPETIIHAAATKFVDLAEKQPMECIDVNVVGSENVARVAMDRGISNVIGISTDKASPPVRNTYGLSKALMERLFCSCDSKSNTRFVCVRYGNVAWSTGSVLPIWKTMHDKTGMIGTTGPEMRRFFFRVEEAVQLVLTAIASAERFRGKVLSRQMKAAQISDILRIWTERKGGEWQRIDGRPGERNDEYLVGEAELPFTSKLEINDISHYLISFNETVPNALTSVVSSANAERLTDNEIAELINNPPAEEIALCCR